MRGDGDQLPWFKFWPKEFLTDPLVCTAPLEVVGAYAILLSHCWVSASRSAQAELPDDDRTLQRLIYFEEPIECSECSQGVTWDRLKGMLFDPTGTTGPFVPTPDGGGWHCPWLTEEFSKRAKEHANKASAGRQGGSKSPAKSASVLLKQNASNACLASDEAILDPDPDPDIDLKKPSVGFPFRKPPKAARSRLVPDDFELTEARLEYAVAQGLTALDAQREFESFRLHEFRDPKSDWGRAWQRWCRTAAQREPPALARGSPVERKSSNALGAEAAARRLGLVIGGGE